MAEAKGTVTALDGDFAFVRIAGEGCGRCHEIGGCGGNNLAQIFCSSSQIHRVLNPRGAQVGEEVVIVIRERALFHSALAGYVLPLLGLFLGAALGLGLAGEIGSMIGALSGLLAAWALQRTRRVQDALSNQKLEGALPPQTPPAGE
jgi:sigma-E factor negative regulatory protein RseC